MKVAIIGGRNFKNKKFLEVDLIVSFWNGYSTSGTKYIINYAKTLNKKLIIFKY